MVTSISELNRQYKSAISSPESGQYNVILDKYVVEYQPFTSIGLLVVRVQIQTSRDENTWRAVERQFRIDEKDEALSLYRDLTGDVENIESFVDENSCTHL